MIFLSGTCFSALLRLEWLEKPFAPIPVSSVSLRLQSFCAFKNMFFFQSNSRIYRKFAACVCEWGNQKFLRSCRMCTCMGKIGYNNYASSLSPPAVFASARREGGQRKTENLGGKSTEHMLMISYRSRSTPTSSTDGISAVICQVPICCSACCHSIWP